MVEMELAAGRQRSEKECRWRERKSHRCGDDAVEGHGNVLARSG